MTQQEKNAFMTLLRGLVAIRDRTSGPLFKVSEYAQEILRQTNDILNPHTNKKGDENATKKAEIITLETDAVRTNGAYLQAKQFAETFIKDTNYSALRRESTRVDEDGPSKTAVYVLTITDAEKFSEMSRWLIDNDYPAYTAAGNTVKLYFEIVLTTGTESAYLINAHKGLTRVK